MVAHITIWVPSEASRNDHRVVAGNVDGHLAHARHDEPGRDDHDEERRDRAQRRPIPAEALDQPTAQRGRERRERQPRQWPAQPRPRRARRRPSWCDASGSARTRARRRPAARRSPSWRQPRSCACGASARSRSPASPGTSRVARACARRPTSCTRRAGRSSFSGVTTSGLTSSAVLRARWVLRRRAGARPVSGGESTSCMVGMMPPAHTKKGRRSQMASCPFALRSCFACLMSYLSTSL